LLRPQVLRDPTEEHRTSTWLELFFDLCFVVAVAALARGLHDDPTLGGILRFLGLFVPVWWAWMGFTWYATAFDNDDVLYRVALLAGMLCILWLAASLDGVPEGRVVSFVLSYVALKLLLSGLYVRASRYAADVRAFAALYAAGNFTGAAIWLSSLLVAVPERYGVWALALFVELLTPILAVRAAYGGAAYIPRVFHPEHIAERYGLFTIIVLGESVLAVAVGTAQTGWEPMAVLAGVLGFVVAACFWWLYFDYVGSSALELSSRTSFYWGYGHLLIYAGIAAAGVGIQLTIEGADYVAEMALAADPPIGEEGGLKVGARAILGGGTALYLAAISFIHWVNRHSLDDRVVFARLGVAAALILLVALGSPLAPTLFAGLVALAMLSLTVFETLYADRFGSA
jgi:low temperature requirement protein LtrA